VASCVDRVREVESEGERSIERREVKREGERSREEEGEPDDQCNGSVAVGDGDAGVGEIVVDVVVDVAPVVIVIVKGEEAVIVTQTVHLVE
jgi:hypothetical protein